MQLCKKCNEQLFGDPVSTLKADKGGLLLTACENCLRGFRVDDQGKVLQTDAPPAGAAQWRLA